MQRELGPQLQKHQEGAYISLSFIYLFLKETLVEYLIVLNSNFNHQLLQKIKKKKKITNYKPKRSLHIISVSLKMQKLHLCMNAMNVSLGVFQTILTLV